MSAVSLGLQHSVQFGQNTTDSDARSFLKGNCQNLNEGCFGICISVSIGGVWESRYDLKGKRKGKGGNFM
jgi:hypothetical protein